MIAPVRASLDCTLRMAGRLLAAPVVVLWNGAEVVHASGAASGYVPGLTSTWEPVLRSAALTVIPDFGERCSLRFAAGAPVLETSGERLGTLLVADYEPRSGLSNEERAALADLAVICADHLRAAPLDEQQFRAIFESSHNAVGVSHRGFHVLVNQSYARLFGYESPEELRGKSIFDLLAPEERERIRQLNAAREAGRPAPAVYEVRGIRRDGTELDLEVHVGTFDLHGERYTTVAIHDITERRQAEEALRQANEKLRALIQASPVAIVAFDPGGRITLWNPAAERTFGWTEQEAINAGVPYVPEDRLHEYEMIRSLTLQGIGLSNVEVQRVRKDGSILELAVSTSPMRDWAGNVSAVMAVYVDITERKRMEEQLREAQKMEAIGRLAGGVAHDFNNLLTIISGYTQMLIDDGGQDPAATRQLLEEVVLAAQRAARLTGQLLAFSRRQIVQMHPVALDEQVRGMENLLRRAIGEHIQLRTVVPPALPLVNANPTQMEQVIMNLALNARDAMPGGGELFIELAETTDTEVRSHEPAPVEPGKYLMLAVRDNGHGIDADTRARIFEPFFTTKAQGKGTGLGLATVYGIVKQHGGYIEVATEPGAGTAFRVYLPAVEAPRPVPIEEAQYEHRRGTETIVVVEDEASLRQLVLGMLRSEGYDVIEAPDVHAALAIASDFPREIHLLLTDVVMPGMGGPELARKVAEIRPGIRVAYMSGYMDQHLSREILSRDGRFLQKPFTKAALVRLVREVLDR